MTDDEIRQIIHRIVITGSGDDDVDDRMDLAIFRAGMKAAAKICENHTCGSANEDHLAGQLWAAKSIADDIRAAANGRAA